MIFLRDVSERIGKRVESALDWRLHVDLDPFFAVLRSRIIFMRFRLRVKILMRLQLRRLRLLLLPYCIVRQNFKTNQSVTTCRNLLVNMILQDLYIPENMN
jgi:hypothetical protein